MPKALLVLLVALAAAIPAAARPLDLARSPSPFRGVGSWVSIYDTAAWRSPERVVRTLARHRVRTLYLETANHRQPVAVVRRDRVVRFLTAAHAAGIDVVGWYLPSFAHPARDVARAVAGARFRTPDGDGFDGFALDIEATTVRSIGVRSRRAVAFAAAVRRALGPTLPLGAITIDPVGARYWPRYPFRALAPSVDVFLPMEYFTARTRGPRRVAAYSAANIRAVRRLAGDARFAVHPIGGEARHATLREVRAFLRASTAEGTVGASLWEYAQTTPRQWAALASAGR